MTEISGNISAPSEDFQQISKDFQTVPKNLMSAVEKNCPGECSYEKKIDPLLEPEAFTHALITSPWSSWAGWSSQSVYMEKSWPGYEGDPTIKKGFSNRTNFMFFM